MSRFLNIAAALLATAAFGSDAPVLRVDHAVLSASSDDEARRLLDKFTKDLGLPETWPFEKHGGRMSGGVYLGNLTLEIAVWPQVEPYQLLGLALRTRDTDAAYAELRARGLILKEPDREPGFWRIATVSQLAGEGLGIFLCHPNAAWLEPHEKEARRQFEAGHGGLVGLTGVASIEIGMNAARRADLEKLLAPAKPDALDPPLSISEGRYRVRTIRVRCRHLEGAKGLLPSGVPIEFVE